MRRTWRPTSAQPISLSIQTRKTVATARRIRLRRRIGNSFFSRFGLDPVIIRVELEAAPFALAVETVGFERVTMHAALVLGVFRQKPLHRPFGLIRQHHF